jgi:hypothetical protein
MKIALMFLSAALGLSASAVADSDHDLPSPVRPVAKITCEAMCVSGKAQDKARWVANGRPDKQEAFKKIVSECNRIYPPTEGKQSGLLYSQDFELRSMLLTPNNGKTRKAAISHLCETNRLGATCKAACKTKSDDGYFTLKSAPGIRDADKALANIITRCAELFPEVGFDQLVLNFEVLYPTGPGFEKPETDRVLKYYCPN